MARYKRLEVLQALEDAGVIPVFYEPDFENAREIVRACEAGGARCIEWTNRGDGAYEVFRELERYCAADLPGVILGAGSIVDAPTAALYISGGAGFIVGPSIDRETAFLCNRRKIAYSPGCGSVSEIQAAHELGVEIVKVFPGSQVGGPAFVKAIRGPLPWASIMPTGGVDATEESLREWFEAGITCAGMGSKLVSRERVAAGNFAAITDTVKRVRAIIAEVRENR